MRLLYLFGAVNFLSSLPLIVTLPASDVLVQPLQSLEKRLWLADLPPIEPEYPGGFYSQRDQGTINRLLDYGDGPNCVLSLLASARNNREDEQRWVGWPLGNDTYRYEGENKCQNFKDLNKMLPNRVSSYQVTGYCECEFFDNENCENGKFRAFNREDDSLKKHGNNDLLESYRCWTEMHLEKSTTCLLFYGPQDLRNELTKKMGGSHLDGDDIRLDLPYMTANIAKDKMFLDGPGSQLRCYRLAPDVQVESIIVRGCSCVFYINDDCTMPLFNPLKGNFGVGNAGWGMRAANGEVDKTSFNLLRSFTCGPPYGVNWYPRYWALPEFTSTA